MASDTAVADAVTKIGYEDIHEQLDNYVVALEEVERGTKHINMKNMRVEFAARMGRSRGIGARAEGEYLPAAGAAKDARAAIALEDHYGTIQGTGKVFRQIQSDTASFVDWMQREMTDIIESLRRDHNRQVYGDGTGTLALLASNAVAATSLVVDDTHWLEIDMTVDILTVGTLGNVTPTSGIVTGTIATITAINEGTNTITISGATVTANTGSAIVLGSYTHASRQNNWKKEWLGLGAWFKSGALHEIDPATYPRWQPGYSESGVGALTELDLTHLVQGVSKQGTKITHFLTTYGVVNQYWSSLQGLRRFEGGEKLKGGVQTPVFQSMFGDIPIIADHSAPTGVLYAINKGEIFLHSLGDWAWLQRDGGIWKQVEGKDEWVAYTHQASNLGVFRRNSLGRLTGISEA